MNKIFNLFIQKATWKKAILFSVVFISFFYLINYSAVGVSHLLKITNGVTILDFEFGYDQEKAFQILTALGIEGRLFYLTRILPLDFPFPLSYMFFYAGWIAYLIKNIYRVCNICSFSNHNKLYKYFLFIPVLAMMFDFIENIGILSMLINYPVLPLWAIKTASYAGMLKTIFTIGSIAIIIILICVLIIKKIKCNKHFQKITKNG